VVCCSTLLLSFSLIEFGIVIHLFPLIILILALTFGIIAMILGRIASLVTRRSISEYLPYLLLLQLFKRAVSNQLQLVASAHGKHHFFNQLRNALKINLIEYFADHA
jgi:hypothetical protein